MLVDIANRYSFLDRCGKPPEVRPSRMRGGEVPRYTTTALLAKRKYLFEVGGFDDMGDGKGIFIANEDKDLSLNIRKAGYKIYYCPDSEAIHSHDYSKVDKNDSYHRTYRLRMEQIAKDTEYFKEVGHHLSHHNCTITSLIILSIALLSASNGMPDWKCI